MDDRPFYQFDLDNYDERDINELRKFHKSNFDITTILSQASDLKYISAIKKLIAQEMENPSEGFVNFFASQVYDGRLSQNTREYFSDVTRRACADFLREHVNQRITSLLDKENRSEQNAPETGDEPEKQATSTESEIVTTQEEVDGYNIVRAIGAAVVTPDRIAMRDVKSYCGILLDDKNTKPICRLHFNTSSKKVQIFHEDGGVTTPVNGVEDLYGFDQQIRDAIRRYLNSA